MNQETIRQINRYKTQIIFLIATIVSILISISIIKILIDISLGRTCYQREANKILYKSRISAIIILISIIYFLFDAIETYKKNQDNTSFAFLVATLLVLIAVSIRVLNLFNPSTRVSNSNDVI